MGFEHTRKTAECNPGVDVYSYTTLSKSLYGPKLRFMVPLYDLWVFFAMVLTAASTISIGGELIASFAGVGYIAGEIILAIIIMCISIFGAEIVRKTSTVMTFAMILMMILLVIITLWKKGDDLAAVLSADWYPPVGGRSLANGGWRIFVLTCSSCSWALGLGAVAQKMTTKKSCLVGGLSAGLLGAFAFFLMFLVVIPWVDKIYVDGAVNTSPVLFIATQWLEIPQLGTVYYILMILALISSGAPSLYVAASRIRALLFASSKSEKQNIQQIICSALFMAVVVIMASGGLTAIVSKYFQYLGYFGQICGVIPMAVVWPILRAKGVKPIIPNLNNKDKL